MKYSYKTCPIGVSYSSFLPELENIKINFKKTRIIRKNLWINRRFFRLDF